MTDAAKPNPIPESYRRVTTCLVVRGAAKALDFEETVNVTLGLPVPRTSPDHGTAYDIAGKGKASPENMVNALLKAALYARSAAQRAGR